MASDPIYFVALPALIVDALDASNDGENSPNLTPLVMEFAGAINPLAAARTTAEKHLDGSTWKMRGHCAASSAVVRLMRDMAQDPRLLRTVAARYPQALDGSALRERALPMLLGLAVATALRLRVGVEAHALATRVAKVVPRNDLKGSDAGTASATYEFKAPALGGPKPELAPIPQDLASPSQ